MADIEVTLNSNVDAVKDATEEAIHTALEMIGMQAQAHVTLKITENGTVDTGMLRQSIQYEVQDHEVHIGTAVHYAPYIEFGTGVYAESGGGRMTPWVFQDRKGNWHRTVGMTPKPFLRPAIQDNQTEYWLILQNELMKI